MAAMISILDLQDIHAGQPGAVLGGGPSLLRDMVKLPREVIQISVNHHALRYAYFAQYLVFIDDPHRHPLLLEDASPLNTFRVRVSRLPEWSDVDLTGADWWNGRFSSHLATWLACWMGCDPVLLCGMDCYQGERPPDADPRDNAYNSPLSEHLNGWRQALEKCPHPERIKAVSGPLVEIFGAYNI
jgi:hypothetical protein